jgi:hypothetical protein
MDALVRQLSMSSLSFGEQHRSLTLRVGSLTRLGESGYLVAAKPR